MKRTAWLVIVSILACLLMADLAAGLDMQPKQVLIETRVIEVGLKAGYLSFTGSDDEEGDDVDNAVGFGLSVGKTIVPNIKFEGNVDYWTKTQEESDGIFKTEWSYSDLSFGGTMYYLVPTTWKSCLFPEFGLVRPFVGVGGAAHLISWEWKQSYDDIDHGMETSLDDSETKFGFHGVGGIQLDIAPRWNGAVEFRYTDVHDLDHWGVFGKVNYLIPY